jgi:hypothetical protein
LYGTSPVSAAGTAHFPYKSRGAHDAKPVRARRQTRLRRRSVRPYPSFVIFGLATTTPDVPARAVLT